MDGGEGGGRAATSPGSPAAGAGPGRPVVDPEWFLATLQRTSDMLVVIDAAANVTWANDAAFRHIGAQPADVLGHSIAEFLHPDDLLRGAEVMALEADGAFDTVPITPALYRVRRVDGTWSTLEINAASSAGDDGSMILLARAGGDLVLTDQLLEAVTGGEPFDRQAELVMELGRWRHPAEGYAILYRELEGAVRASISNGLPPVLRGEEPVEGATPWDRALELGEDVLITDLGSGDGDAEAIGPALRARAVAAGFTGCLAAPVPDPGHPDGACLVVWTRAEGPTMAGHGYAVGNMRRALALVLQQRAQIATMERAARIDHLTGVVSRGWFFDLLARTADDATSDAVHTLLYVDLDGFKAVNDGYGHASGDRVLAVAARRLERVAPDGATLARMGGDEFVLLLPPDTAIGRAHALAQEIVDALAEPIEVAEVVLHVGASVGVAVGDRGQSAQDVLDAADRALLAAKAQGRGRWLAAP